MVTEKKFTETIKIEGYIGRNDYGIRDFRILSKEYPNKNTGPEEEGFQ